MPQSLFPPILAVAVVLIGAASFEPADDQQMVAATTGGREVARVCVKSRAACDLAIEAVRKRWIFIELAIDGAELWCEPARAGQCFDARSNCIVGFNCPAGVR